MKQQHFQIIKALYEEPKTFWNIVKEVDGTIKELFSSLNELNKNSAISYKNCKFFLKDKKEYKEIIKRNFNKELKEFNKISAERPPAVMKYFQGAINSSDIFKRIWFIYERGDMVGKDFFILGDDDLLSIAIALTGLSRRIFVAEIDDRIINFIKKTSKKYNLDIETLKYNCSLPLPKRLKKKFDVFVTDPVETKKGFATFMSRGIAALKHPGAVYFGLTEIECSFSSWYDIQKDIIKMNLFITDILKKFSFYPENEGSEEEENYPNLRLFKQSPFILGKPDCNWYNSDFIRLQTIGITKPIVTGRVKFNESFYKNADIMSVI